MVKEKQIAFMNEMNENDYRLMEDLEPKEAIKVGCLTAGGYILIIIIFFIICACVYN